MTLGLVERQGDLLDGVSRFCEATLPENSIFAVLHRERDRLFADFAMLAAAVNLARLAVLGLASAPDRGWVTAAG